MTTAALTSTATRTVLAALDASPAARAVLDAAIGIATLMEAEVEALHVRQDDLETPTWLAEHRGVRLHVVTGPVGPALLDAIDAEAVVAAVFGARSTPGGRRPAGHTALHVLERATKPVVVVPPELASPPRTYRRLLLPLEGRPESSAPILECLCPLVSDDVELIVLHVFTEATMPRTLDRPQRDLALWSDEFMARYCPAGTRIELRTGPVGVAVAEMCAEADVDLVVLSWAQDISPGHAAVVHHLLDRGQVPVLLLPVADLGDPQADATVSRSGDTAAATGARAGGTGSPRTTLAPS